MATKVSFNSKILTAMHRPVTKEGYVLYPKIKGYTGNEEMNTKAEADESYKKASEVTFNSPTNIRRLFITGNRVMVHYYARMVVSGKVYNSLVSTHTYEGESIFDIARNIFSYAEDEAKYVAERTINKNAVKPTQYEVTGNVIGVAANNYACNNLEEIYFDWTALLSQDVAPYFQDIAGDRNKMLACANKQTQLSESVNDNCARMFADFCSGGVKDIRKRFPRLRVIGLISNLDDVITNAGMQNHTSLLSEKTKRKETYYTWFQVNQQLIKQTNSVCILSILRDLKIPNREFRIKNETYKFDAEVLKGRISEYLETLTELSRTTSEPIKVSIEKTDEPVEDIGSSEMGEAEQVIMDLLNTAGEPTVKKLFIIVTNNKPKSVIDELVNSFTSTNKQRLKKLMGIG